MSCDADGNTLTDVTLAADITISNGILEGTITGDTQSPARLENIDIADNAILSGVILTDTVTLGDNVDLTALLSLLPVSEDCLLSAPAIDLSQDVF